MDGSVFPAFLLRCHRLLWQLCKYLAVLLLCLWRLHFGSSGLPLPRHFPGVHFVELLELLRFSVCSLHLSSASCILFLSSSVSERVFFLVSMALLGTLLPPVSIFWCSDRLESSIFSYLVFSVMVYTPFFYLILWKFWFLRFLSPP